MRILEKNILPDCIELKVEEKLYSIFSSKKVVKVYRMYGDSIFLYEYPDNFYHLGAIESLSVRQFFKIKINGA